MSCFSSMKQRDFLSSSASVRTTAATATARRKGGETDCKLRCAVLEITLGTGKETRRGMDGWGVRGLYCVLM